MTKRLITRSVSMFGATLFLLMSWSISVHAVDPSSDLGFFPWQTGDSWVYDTLDKKSKSHFDMKVSIAGAWKEDGSSGMIMVQKDKRGTMREFQLLSDKGIFISRLGLSKSFTPEIFTRFNPPVPRVIFPLEVGTTVHWEGLLKVVGVNKNIIFGGKVEDEEDVDVPAGHFHCVKLHYHETRGSDVIDENAWYATGIGQVKYEGGQYVKVLKSYKMSGV